MFFVLNFKRIILELLPPGPDYLEIPSANNLIKLISKELERTYFLAKKVSQSNPDNETLKDTWDKTLGGSPLSSKGYFNEQFGKTVSSTPNHFQQIIKSMGREIEVEIKDNEILFYGAILKHIPSPIPGRGVLIRDDDFIDVIEKTKLAHVKTRYLEKRKK